MLDHRQAGTKLGRTAVAHQRLIALAIAGASEGGGISAPVAEGHRRVVNPDNEAANSDAL